MNGKKLTVEISRHCGWDNAMLTAEIDTDTNAVTPHSSVLAWRMPGTAEPGGLPTELDTTEAT